MKRQKRITFIHLLNDYSGSPLVLSNIIKGLRDLGYQCKLMTSKNNEGFLSNIEGIEYDFFRYRFVENKWIRLFFFFYTQVVLVFKILIQFKSESTIYVNTLLPFGAAIAGKLSGQKVIYHIHETSLKPLVFKRFLKWVARRTCLTTIYVSDYLKRTEGFIEVPSITVHNALSNTFRAKADEFKQKRKEEHKNFKVLMLCSLKAYKGVNEFVELAKMLPCVQFKLVLNSPNEPIAKYFSGTDLPGNLEILPTQKNVHPLYSTSHLVLNLSHPEQWVETFGMTILEGMYYGLPSIAPPVGGPAEIIKNEQNGFLIDQRDLEKIAHQIRELALNRDLYRFLSQNALQEVTQYNHQNKIAQIQEIIEN